MSAGEGSGHAPFNIGSLDDWRARLRQYHDLNQQVQAQSDAFMELPLPLGTDTPLAERIAFQRNTEMRALVAEAARSRFLTLAAAMQSGKAPQYVIRALGEPHAAFGMHWYAVRAQIEVGRQLFGVEDTNVTLGPPPTNPHNEPWEQHYYHDIVVITQHIQLGQIMLAGAESEGDPRAVASGFGKPQLVDELGLPPAYPPSLVADLISSGVPEVDEWLRGTYELLNVIEPPQAGLLIDQG